jgi:hypothetical protein
MPPRGSGAGKEARTPDLNLGKVALYQLSYSRVRMRILSRAGKLSSRQGQDRRDCVRLGHAARR